MKRKQLIKEKSSRALNIQICYCKRGDEEYKKVCDFAFSVYKKRLNAELKEFHHYFVYAKKGDKIVGCLGFTNGDKKNPLLVETYFDFNLLNYISDYTKIKRKSFGEIGTLAVFKENNHLVIFLIAGIIILCNSLKIKFVALTTTKIIQKMSLPLQIRLKKIGKPNLKSKDEEFLKNWRRYFLANPESVAIDIQQAINGSIMQKEKSNNYGVIFDY
ncbi:thermostable hemolysin [Candidatus Parcubacteria bacterium]|nr:thermostable hemolysin [Candidatus Parcubacteria bacterium]